MERQEPQEVLVDISVALDLSPAGRADDLSSTVDYVRLMNEASAVASQGEYVLLEGFAETLAAAALTFPNVQRVRLRVRKAKYSSAPSVGVEIERGRD